MNRSIVIRSALIQLLSVAALSLLLALLLPNSFFQSWGWLSGPTAWMLCATLTATVLALPRGRTLLGAVLAGLPSIIAVVIGIHWLGALLAVLLFSLWCGTGPGREPGRYGSGGRVSSANTAR